MLTSRNLSAQYVAVGQNYWIKAFDGPFELECLIPTDETLSADTVDFLANFQAKANRSPSQALAVSSTPAFASKSFGAKSLFKRLAGQQASLVVGSNTILYTVPFAWVKFISLEVIGGQAGDVCSLYVLDSADGRISGVANYQLNQFGFNANIAADFYAHKSEFDADLYAGLQLKMLYTSIGAKTIGINYVMNEVK